MSSNAAGLEAHWPPRSPREALLSTPGGRERYRQIFAQRSSSPSPSKGPSTQPAPNRLTSSMSMDMDDPMDVGDPMDVDDEDDEETLQLKLQQIQAQLRLKKLRKDKARSQNDPHSSFSQHSDQDSTKASRPGSASTARPGLRIKEIRRTDAAARPPSQVSSVEVPASPVRKAQPQTDQTSPSRILLGIDKGLKGKDISLKRAPSLRKAQDDPGGSHGGTGILHRSRTPGAMENKPRPLSFNERLAAARTEEKTREETRSKASRSRSSAFNVTKQEMEDYKNAAVDMPNEPSPRERLFARDDNTGMAPPENPRNARLHRSNTAPSIRTISRLGHDSTDSGSFSSQVAGSFSSQVAGSFSSTISDTPKSPSASFDVYSGFHLSKRILPHQVVARAVSGKTTYSIKDLLRQVKAPEWSLPDDVVDSVVFAIVATKSDPRHHKPQYGAEAGKMKQPDRGKYMVLTLVDLQYEVELFLFNSGFERFWKLSTGTVVAILNPDFMPPPPGRADTGRFSLTINSDADTILEIGTARDLGYCKSIKADGKFCNSWVNARRTEHCGFHTNTALSRTRSARQEVNSTGGLGSSYNGPRSKDRTWLESAEAKRRAKVEEEHGRFDWETRSRYFVNGGARGQSASLLIDRDGIFSDARERAEGLKRKLAAQEKERDIAKKLGEMGSGSMGGEYMRISGAAQPVAPQASSSRAGSRAASRLNGTRAGGPRTVPSTSTFKPEVRLPGVSLPTHDEDGDEQPRKTDTRSLGLLAPRGSSAPKISLSPIKRKRQDSTLSSNNSFDSKHCSAAAGASAATGRLSAATASTGRPAGGFGWGTSLRDKLSRMRAGERLSLHTSHNSISTTVSGSSSGGSSSGAGVAVGGAFRDKDRSPVRKKTRFVTDKGIREAGRESLPGSVVAAGAAEQYSGGVSRGWNSKLASRQRQQQHHQEVVFEGDDDDDDELVVVR